MINGGVWRAQTSTIQILTTIGAAVLVAAALVYLGLGESYPLFHLIAEFFAIAVAVATFMIAWNSRQRAESGYLVFLGIAYFFVAGIDLLHAVSYRGMNLVPGATPTSRPSSGSPPATCRPARSSSPRTTLTARQRPSGLLGLRRCRLLVPSSSACSRSPTRRPGLTTFKIASELIIAASWPSASGCCGASVRLSTPGPAAHDRLYRASRRRRTRVRRLRRPVHGTNMVGHCSASSPTTCSTWRW